jgi:hypothetical protein
MVGGKLCSDIGFAKPYSWRSRDKTVALLKYMPRQWCASICFKVCLFLLQVSCQKWQVNLCESYLDDVSTFRDLFALDFATI